MIPSIPYEASGRTRQKQRTRAALVELTRRLMAEGITPSVDMVAEQAAVSRTTAYRYFRNQNALLAAAFPDLGARGLLPPSAPPADVVARLDLVLTEHFRIIRDWEPQLRAALRLALSPERHESPLRAGRAIGWFQDALAPLGGDDRGVDVRALAIQLRAACGIEAYVWLVDVARLTPNDAMAMMRSTSHAILSAHLGADSRRLADAGEPGSG